jgi:hypothetical protein
MAIKIPVSAEFDGAGLQQQIKMVNDQIRILGSQVGACWHAKDKGVLCLFVKIVSPSFFSTFLTPIIYRLFHWGG